MTFVSISFIILFLVTYILMQLVKEHKKRLIILLLASYVFYAYGDIRFVLLLIAEEYMCYYLAKRIDKEHKKTYVVIGVVVSLTILGFFKYFNFFRASIYSIFNISDYSPLNIILPLGISFYIFQSLSYLIDVYRKKIKAEESFLKVALFISFFPKLITGPLVRAADFLPQLDENRNLSKENLLTGLQMFTLGMVKKMVIADRLAVCVNSVFAAPLAYSGSALLCAAISYTIQIYCDFSGYSDMAIGIAKVFGFDLCQNFKAPYISANPTEFWKRWHISLSSWLQDYLYIPLGGNRRGELRRNFNLFITMLLGGLWHGASWNFVIWGGLHGIALIAHKYFHATVKKYNLVINNKYLKTLTEALAIMINNIFVTICWVFFGTSNLQDALIILGRIVTWSQGINYIYVYTVIFAFVVGIAHIWYKLKKNNNDYVLLDLSKFSNQVVFFLIWWIIIGFCYIGDTAFIYFKF